ncbi:type II toxin-antitoxin system RelE/ParE family toxin [Lamprobacter modestohalophilus]|uniref:type II toxin-antitoxin system RelE/ParE family toxin n=1 Tax=Lamprobacter modestohalophilus TaxID=1064514 RepID=UPI003D18CAE3
MRVPPGNRLEALSGNRKGQLSIRMNEQYRVCFVWGEKAPVMSKSLITTEKYDGPHSYSQATYSP